MDKFKLELDIFDEHHLGNILFDMFDEDERPYVYDGYGLMVEGIEPQEIINATVSQDQKFIIEYGPDPPNTVVNIYTLGDKKVPWRAFTIKTTGFSGCNIVDNLFYYFIYDTKSLYILDFSTNIKYCMTIEHQNTIYSSCDIKILPNGKILIIFPTYFCVINLDWTYYVTNQLTDDFVNTKYSVCGNKLYMFSQKYRAIMTYDTDTCTCEIFKKFKFEVNKILITSNNIVAVVHSYKFLNIYGKKNISIDLSKYCNLQSIIDNPMNILINTNKYGNKLILAINDDEKWQSCELIFSLEENSLGKEMGFNVRLNHVSSKIGFISLQQIFDYKFLNVEEYKETVIRSRRINWQEPKPIASNSCSIQ
jgi:hypothetical protein